MGVSARGVQALHERRSPHEETGGRAQGVVRGTSFDLRFVTVAQIVDLIYQEAMHTPYVLGPDVLPSEVVVRGWVYEVANTDSTNTAWSIAVRMLSGQLRVSSGDTSSDASAVRFTGPGVDAAISALNADSRFKVVSAPHVRIVSGERVRLNVGQQVPTQSSVSYQGSTGTPVQSITYQDAGLIFDVEPTVMREVIELKVREEISDFVATKTGVDTSPTKNTRQLQTVTRLKDGEVVVLGGLIQDRNATARSGYAWVPSFLDGRSSSKQRTEVLLVLQVQRI
ncbi:type II secretion system protein GspD [Burkholderia pseudomallei]|uniref:type II secretion system protein GspD n=1 Tax=Burkholderia pseudomallei TaxID=28450 RepID=UPI001FD77FA4|nr:hypothetical protein [Burkholderia pseudomallei]